MSANPSSIAAAAREGLSESQEDYLKQVLLLTVNDEPVSTQALATRMSVRPASVTGMVRRLADLRLLDHRPYHGVRLTDTGRLVALEMLRHHRLLETYLAESLGYRWDQVHAEAERLEHVISERFESRIAEILNHPTRDPHGDPIPTAELELPPEDGVVCLADLREGCTGTVVRVGTQDPDVLAYLEHLGLVPGAVVTMVGRVEEPAGARVSVGEHRFMVPESTTQHLDVIEESVK